MWKFVYPAPFRLGTSEPIRRIFSLFPSPCFIPSSPHQVQTIRTDLNEWERGRKITYLQLQQEREIMTDGVPVNRDNSNRHRPPRKAEKNEEQLQQSQKIDSKGFCIVQSKPEEEVKCTNRRKNCSSIQWNERETTTGTTNERWRFNNYLLNPVRSKE